MRKQGILFMIAMLMALCLLASCKGKDLTPPESYAVGEDSVPSVDQAVGEEGVQLRKSETLPGETKDAPPAGVLYTYTLPAGPASLKSYLDSVTSEDQGFQVVNEENKLAQVPDFSTETGSVLLAKTSTVAGMLFRLEITWTKDSCQVSATQVAGALDAPKEEESMTARDAVSFLKRLSPQLLNLSGSSMNEYNVYYLDGEVWVDRIPCMRLQVYRPDPQGGQNIFAGSYLLSGDKLHLYRLDAEEDDAIPIPLTAPTQQEFE